MAKQIKSAVALFVKNEVTDIAGWIAWHAALGFDKIYVYDDHSTDGTYEVCCQAKKIVDIEIIHTELAKATNFFWRQKDSYFDACTRAANDFDWLAFLDADEYITIDGNMKINDYLLKFERFNGIALNWCIYGSSGRVIKDHIPVYQAFKSHSDENLDDNRLVKSIIRPKDCLFHYSDPHKFHLNNESYADSKGETFEWTGSTKNIQWEGARVNHYICRSMEHYVGRIKRRLGVDLVNSITYWNHFDRNEKTNLSDISNVEDANVILQKIKSSCIASFCNEIIIKNKYSFSDVRAHDCALFKIKSNNNMYLCLNNQDGHVVQSSNIEEEKFPIYGIIFPGSKYIYLVSLYNNNISNVYFHINDSNVFSFCYAFELFNEEENNFFYLKSPINEHFMCCLPPEHGGKVICDKKDPSDWEKIYLVKSDISIEVYDKLDNIRIYSDIVEYINNYHNADYNDILVALSQVNSETIPKNQYDKISWLL